MFEKLSGFLGKEKLKMPEQIVAIAGVARSGTSWLGQIIDSSPDVAYRFQPLFSYAFKGSVDTDSSKEEFEHFFKNIYQSNDEFLLQADKRKAGLYPVFKEKKQNPRILAFKTCRYQYVLNKMLYCFDNVKLLGIIRNPCGVINSWLKNPKEFPQGANARKEWRFGACKNQGREEEFFGYYKWKEVAHLYLDLKEKYPDKVYIVKYEELVDNPIQISRDIFVFFGMDFSGQTRSFLESCHSVSKEGPYTVFKYKSVKESWKSELDPYISDEIHQDLEGTRLAKFLE